MEDRCGKVNLRVKKHVSLIIKVLYFLVKDLLGGIQQRPFNATMSMDGGSNGGTDFYNYQSVVST